MTDVQLTELEANGKEEDGDRTIQTSPAITRDGCRTNDDALLKVR